MVPFHAIANSNADTRVITDELVPIPIANSIGKAKPSRDDLGQVAAVSGRGARPSCAITVYLERTCRMSFSQQHSLCPPSALRQRHFLQKHTCCT